MIVGKIRGKINRTDRCCTVYSVVCLLATCRVFVIDLLNFSFWSDEADDRPKYSVSYAGNEWTGYWTLCAAFNRAIHVCQSVLLITVCI